MASTVLPFASSFALLVLLACEALLPPWDVPLHDEGAVEHVGMLLAAGQVPFILWGFISRLRRQRAAFPLAALQSASLALGLGMVMALQMAERHEVRVRIEAADPFPGGAQAVRSFLAAPAAHDASSAVRGFLDRKGDEVARDIDGLGAIQSIRFDGVDTIGWDSYAVTFDKGVRHVHLYLADDARLLGIALVDAASGCLSSEIYDCRYLHRPFRGVNANRP
jgi:hypothetical protein